MCACIATSMCFCFCEFFVSHNLCSILLKSLKKKLLLSIPKAYGAFLRAMTLCFHMSNLPSNNVTECKCTFTLAMHCYRFLCRPVNGLKAQTNKISVRCLTLMISTVVQEVCDRWKSRCESMMSLLSFCPVLKPTKTS